MVQIAKSLLEIKNLLLEEVLHQLAVENTKRNNKIKSNGPIEDRETLFRLFISSDELRDLYTEAINRFLTSDGRGLEGIKNDFAGGLFHRLAYLFLVASQNNSQIVLSPEATREFYLHLFPYASLTSGSFGSASIFGLSVPDGIVLKSVDGIERVIALCEYAQVNHKTRLVAKYRGLTKDLEQFRTLFNNAYILFLVPDGMDLPIELQSSQQVRIQRVPFNRYQFGGFVDFMLSYYRTAIDGATLLEITQRARHQQRPYSQPLKTA